VKWKIFLLIAVISTAVYANSFHNSFHFDDQHYIVENPYIQDLSNIPSFFLSPQHSSFEKVFTSHYRPLLVTSYAVNYAIGGLNPAGYHIVNLLFHTGSAFLLYLILQAVLLKNSQPEIVSGSLVKEFPNQLRDDRNSSFVLSIAAALVFSVHPFNSEVVNYITARSSVMCSFFYLLSFYLWIKFRAESFEHKSGGISRFSYYIASIPAFILAMLTKEIAITLPVVLFIYDFYFKERLTGSNMHNSSFFIRFHPARFIAYLPHIFLIIIPYLIYRISVYGYIAGSGSRSYLTNLMAQPKVLLKYIQLLFVPAGLTIEHDIGMSGSVYDVWVILSWVSILIILCAAYLLFKRGNEWKLLSFFILWFFITLLPTTLIPLNAVLQENRGYIGGIVLAVFAGVLISRFKRKIWLPALTVLIMVFSIITVQRNLVWSNDLSLWNDAVGKSPLSARAHDNLGLAWMGMKKYDRALEEFDKTLKINPQYYLAWYNTGVAYQFQGDLEKAKHAYEESLRINPVYFRSWYNVGIVYKRLGDLDLSVKAYDKAIALDPRHPFVYNNLGVALIEKGDYKRAEGVLKTAVSINPGYEKAYYNLGNIYFRDKDYPKAVEAYMAAVRIRPDYKEANEMLKEAIERK